MTTAIGDPAPIERAVLTARQIDADEIITATYKAVLGRPADPSGLQTYGKIFRAMSLPQGVERVVRGLLSSPEFQSKRAALGERSSSAINVPQIRALTPEEARWLSSLDIQVNRVLVARFRLEPGSHPTIQLRDPSIVNLHRFSQSLNYIKTIIYNYLIHEDHYFTHVSTIMPVVQDLHCIFQIKDDPVDVLKTIGYSSMGSNMTLIPDLHFWASKGYFNLRQELIKSWIPWKDRVPRVFWRGSSTGAEPISLKSLSNLPRFRLCALSAGNTGLRNVLDSKLTNIVQASSTEQAAKIRAYVDKRGLISGHVPQTDFLKYRFQIDIDGNSNSWSFLPKLMMGSCILKVGSTWRQWFYDGLRPWEHYVPIKNDLSDLEERVAWCIEHDDDAREIGANGMTYAAGMVFGTEMLRAADAVLRASRETLGP